MDANVGGTADSLWRGQVPLLPVSPSRENRLPISPSLPSISPTRNGHERFAGTHTRSGSDVQNKVAAFNNLTKEAAQRKRDNEAALKRAMLGREEAESEARRLKDECDTLRRDIEGGRGRERRVGERLENVMEELQRVKENQALVQLVYEKEVRKARKEAFKSSSALVNLQEELKTARNRYTLMRVEAEDERQKGRTKEQEFSASQQQLVMMAEQLSLLKQQTPQVQGDQPEAQQELEAAREELHMLKQQNPAPIVQETAKFDDELRAVSEELFIFQQKLSKAERKVEKVEMQKQVIEEEMEALKHNMEEEQAAKDAARSASALPLRPVGARASPDSPRPSSRDEEEKIEQDRDQMHDMLEIEVSDDLSQLRHKLLIETRMRREAEEQVHLALMECQFGCCSCRRAEKLGISFVHDDSLVDEIAKLTSGRFSAEKAVLSKSRSPDKSRGHQLPSRSATPKLAMPQRPRSQQAIGRQATPKLLQRPQSQQAESRRITPRPPRHNRSVTETTFKTARELDLQARRSISRARTPTATPISPSPPTAHHRSDSARDIVQKADDDNEQADARNEEMLAINFSSPGPDQPFMPDDTVHHIQSPPPPSPTMDFNFTEIIPNVPSIPPPPPSHISALLPAAKIDPTPLISDQDLFSITAAPPPTTTSTTTTTRTTMQIPTKDSSSATELFSPAPNTPGGISREEALEQIRARRGRARSYHTTTAASSLSSSSSAQGGAAAAAAAAAAPTPKRAGITGTPRREISAPNVRRL